MAWEGKTSRCSEKKKSQQLPRPPASRRPRTHCPGLDILRATPRRPGSLGTALSRKEQGKREEGEGARTFPGSSDGAGESGKERKEEEVRRERGAERGKLKECAKHVGDKSDGRQIGSRRQRRTQPRSEGCGRGSVPRGAFVVSELPDERLHDEAMVIDLAENPGPYTAACGGHEGRHGADGQSIRRCTRPSGDVGPSPGPSPTARESRSSRSWGLLLQVKWS